MFRRLKRKIKRKFRNLSTNKLVMFISVFLVCFITVGYASLNQILKLVGYASIDAGDGIIFTNIETKENNGATIVNEGNIKAKTLVNTEVSFDAPGSITYTITAENQAEYDAKLVEIKDLELTNNKEPSCITVSVSGHEINDKIYTGATKEFDITITSACNTYSSKEIDLKFNYVKTDTINNQTPNVSNITDILLNKSESTYNYLNGTYLGGQQSSNYVWFNGFMWRIMGKNADGSVRMITEENVTAIPWGASNTAEQYDSSYVNDWLNNYFYPKLKNKEWLVKQTWCSELTTDSTSARQTCSNNLSTTPQYVGLISLDEYNLASASSSYLVNSQYFWTLTPYSASDAWSLFGKGYTNYTSVLNAYGVRPVINVSFEITITGGNGTLTDPYMFEDKSSSVTGTLKDNSQIGEYVTYAGRNYRVVETSDNGTKLILDGYYDSNNDGTVDTSDKMEYGENCTLCKTIKEDFFINWLSNNNENEIAKLSSTTWYRGDNWGSSTTSYNYKTNLESTSNPYVGSVGLIRVGEMLSGQSETILSKNHTVSNDYDNAQPYWTATPRSASVAWNVYKDGNASPFSIPYSFGLRPVINIDPDIQIISGNGTPNSPYELGDAPETAAHYLINNKLQSSVANGGNGLAAMDSSGLVTSSSSPREYRYIGPNPNNYVSFNGELWRIIGIFDERIKIIRKDSLGNMFWDDEDINDWTTASLQQLLNEQYYYKTGNYTLNGMSDVARQMTDTITWKLGGISNWNNTTVQMFYNQERGTLVADGRPVEWIGNIGLLYPSDFGFATSGGTTTGRNTCLANILYNWDSYTDCRNNSWLFDNSTDQWTLTPLGAGDVEFSEEKVSVFYISKSGYVSRVPGTTFEYSVRPTLYLKSYISITSGSGTSTDPYILE